MENIILPNNYIDEHVEPFKMGSSDNGNFTTGREIYKVYDKNFFEDKKDKKDIQKEYVEKQKRKLKKKIKFRKSKIKIT